MSPIVKAALYLGAAGVVLFAAYKAISGRRKDLPNLTFPRFVVCIGDSITQDGRYVNRLKSLLGTGNTVKKYGYQGEGTGYLAKKLPSLMYMNPTDVVIQGGVNDLASGRSTSTVTANLSQMIDFIHSHGARAVLVEILPWAGHHKGKNYKLETSVVNSWMNQDSLADAVVDGSSMGDSSGKLKAEYDSGDHLHLNGAGQVRLGDLVFEHGFHGG